MTIPYDALRKFCKHVCYVSTKFYVCFKASYTKNVIRVVQSPNAIKIRSATYIFKCHAFTIRTSVARFQDGARLG